MLFRIHLAPFDNMHWRIFRMFFLVLLTSMMGVRPCHAVILVPQDNHGVKTDYNHVLVDSKISSDSLTAYSFNDLNDALDYALIMGSAELMTIYITPGNYTIKSINCNNILLSGLSVNGDDIVIRRAGGTAEFRGDGIRVENATIDDCLFGDMIHYKNCKLITPPGRILADASGRRLYEKCRFECYDDALNGDAVYVNCTFELYSGAPIYESAGNGTIFLGCLFKTYFSDVLYLTRKGRVALADCEFNGDCAAVYWTPNPRCQDRYYQDGVTLRGTDYIVSNDTLITVDMSGLRLSEAYSFTYKGAKHYNIYNLLQGSDGWDPLQQKKTLSAVSSFYGRKLTELQTELSIYPTIALINSKKDTITFQAKGVSVIGWNVTDERLRLIPEKDNNMISLTINSDVEDVNFTAILEVYTDYGLQASSELKIKVQSDAKKSKISEKRSRLFGRNKRVGK